MKNSALLARIAELEADNAQLRETLGLTEAPPTAETWAIHAPQHLRDRLAATALVAENLYEPRALLRLGFKIARNHANRWDPEVWVLAKQIFGTPGVREILDQDLKDAEANKAAIIARLVQTSVHGTDGESVRAAQQLSKIAGWNNADKGTAPGSITNYTFNQIISGKAVASDEDAPDTTGVIDAEYFLDHEPGDATLISDEEDEEHDRKALSR